MRKEIRDFSGGITDFVYQNDTRCFEVGENLIITKDKSIETRPGSHVIDDTNPRPSTTSTAKSAHLYDFNGDLISVNGSQISVFSGGTWTVISGSTNTDLLTNGDITANYDIAEWNNHIFITDNKKSKSIKIYKDNLGTYKGRTAGLPKLSSTPTITPEANDGKSYIYSFVAYYEYMVGDVKFIDYGPTISTRIENAADPSLGLGHYNDISGIPTIIGDNIDSANIKIRIFRSKDAETVEYHVGEVVNGTATFEDTVTDDVLETNEIIYTDGGAFDNDEPPIAKYIEMNGGAMIYAGIDGYPDRVYQSVPGDPDSVPSSFYESFGDPVMGLTSFQSNAIVFTNESAWRVEGFIEADGSGAFRKILLSESIGCINNNSIVRTKQGIYWAGNDGFYFSNGFNEPMRIPDEINGDSNKNISERYATVKLSPSDIKAAYDRRNKRIFWTTKNGASTELYVYDIAFNSFTTWAVDDATSIVAIEGDIYRGDGNGYISVHTPTRYNDDVIDVGVAVANWSTKPVIHTWKHIQYDFDISDIYKWVVKVTASGLSKTDLNLKLTSYDDSLGQGKDLKEIEFVSGLIWGDPRWVWGDGRLWTLEPRFSQTRRFPSGKIRCKNKQLQITNSIARLAESYSDDPNSQVTVTAATNTISLVDPTVVSFPEDAIGYEIVIDERNYEITAQSADTVVVSDPDNHLVDGQFDWHVEGYARNQRLNLNSLIFTYQNLDDDGGYYQGSTSRR